MTTILIVDDEPDIVSTLSMVLQLEGFEIVEATNGEVALKRIQEARPDLVLSDVMMPVMNGLELLAAIKGAPELQTIPVIIMSAARLDVAKFPCPCDAFLRKPLGLDELVPTIRTLLARVAEGPP